MKKTKKDNRINDVFRIKVDYEQIPLTDQKVKGVKGLRDLLGEIEYKFKGGKK